MKLNTSSLIIGWFGALILLWLVVSLNNQSTAVAIESNSLPTEYTTIESKKKHSLKGF